MNAVDVQLNDFHHTAYLHPLVSERSPLGSCLLPIDEFLLASERLAVRAEVGE